PGRMSVGFLVGLMIKKTGNSRYMPFLGSGEAVMSQLGDHPGDSDPVALLEWVDEVADRFEAGWAAGRPPRITDHLGDTAGKKRAVLVRELVKIDLERRVKAGEQRQWEDYVREFPELLDPDGLATDFPFASGETVKPFPGPARDAIPAPVALRPS